MKFCLYVFVKLNKVLFIVWRILDEKIKYIMFIIYELILIKMNCK